MDFGTVPPPGGDSMKRGTVPPPSGDPMKRGTVPPPGGQRAASTSLPPESTLRPVQRTCPANSSRSLAADVPYPPVCKTHIFVLNWAAELGGASHT